MPHLAPNALSQATLSLPLGVDNWGFGFMCRPFIHGALKNMIREDELLVTPAAPLSPVLPTLLLPIPRPLLPVHWLGSGGEGLTAALPLLCFPQPCQLARESEIETLNRRDLVDLAAARGLGREDSTRKELIVDLKSWLRNVERGAPYMWFIMGWRSCEM